MWDEKGKTLAAYTHTAAGNIDRHVVGDEVATGTYAYNAHDWVAGIDYPGKFTVTQQYDDAGNVSSQSYRRAASETLKAAANTYDSLHRLTAFNLDSGSSAKSYEYDRNGNFTRLRTNGVTTWYEYYNTSTPNRVTAVYGGRPFIQTTHNLNGWITRFAGNVLTYDYRGLVTGHGSATYTMGPDRRRVKKIVGTAVTYYLRGPDGSVLAEYSGQTLSARYVYAGSRRIARVEGDSASYYLTDHLGSTRSLVDEAGAVTATYDYWPYGKVLATSGTDATHFRFTGHERDSESGLDYMLERSYAYNIGRFLRPDPMQDEYPGLSPYAYANNNPLKYVDPDGRILRKVVTKGLKVAGRAYDAAKKGKSLLKKDTWKDIGTDELVNFVDNVSTITDGVWDANDVFAIIDLAMDQGELAKRVTKGLGNPFKGKSPKQIDRLFRNKGFETRGPNPLGGKGDYVNPKTGRSYHIMVRYLIMII